MKVNAKELSAAFKLVDRVPQHVNLMASQYVKGYTEKGKLNLQLGGLALGKASIPCKDGDLQFIVERRILGGFLGNTEEEVTLTVTNNVLTLKSGKSKVEATQPEASVYHNWTPKKEAQRVDVDPDLLRFVGMFASIVPGGEHLEAIQLSKGYGVLASDSFAIAACLDKRIGVNGAVPRALVRYASEEEELLVEAGGGGLYSKTSWLYQPLAATDKPFPLEIVKGVIKDALSKPVSMVVQGQALLDGIKYLQTFAWGSGDFAIKTAAVKGGVNLTMETAVSKAECFVAAKTVKDMGTEGWSIAPVAAWINRMRESEITVAVWDAGLKYAFSCKTENQTHILILTSRG